MHRAIAALVLLFCLAHSAEQRFFVDDFVQNGTDPAYWQKLTYIPPAVITSSDPPAYVNDTFVEDNCTFSGVSSSASLLGCSRSIQLEVSECWASTYNAVLVSGGFLQNAMASETVATFTVQWDNGEDFTLDPSGLGGVDFTSRGFADALEIDYACDFAGVATMRLYSPDSSVCSLEFYPSARATADPPIYLSYSSFSTACNLTDIGAVELEWAMAKADDVQVYNVSVVSIQEARYSIDTFDSPVDGQHFFVLPDESSFNDPPQVTNSSVDYPGCGSGLSGPLVGCSRDVTLTVYEAGPGQVLSVGVNGGICSLSNTQHAVAEVVIKWDGTNGAGSIDYNGLGGLDLTDGGLAQGIRFSAWSDIGGEWELTLYSTDASACSLTFAKLTSGVDYAGVRYTLPFADFSGSCDVTDIGAIVLSTPLLPANDVLLYQIEGYGYP